MIEVSSSQSSNTILNQPVYLSLSYFLKEINFVMQLNHMLLHVRVTYIVLNSRLRGWHIHFSSIFRLLLTLKSRSIVRLFSIPPHGKVVVGGCDDGCYVWKLFDGKSNKGDKRWNVYYSITRTCFVDVFFFIRFHHSRILWAQ